MRLVGYVRVSSESQAENTSLADQQKKIEDWCKLFGHELVKVFVEVGSGKDAKTRPQFQSAIKLIEHDADGIITSKLDRLVRSTRDIGVLTEETLIPKKKHIILVEQGIDTSTPTGIAMLEMMAVIAKLERHQINERTQGGRKAKAKDGGYAYGSPKFGQQSIEGELVANEKELETIEIIRKHHKSGKSLGSIANYLNEKNYQTKQGKKWYASSVKNIIDRLYKKPA